MSAGFKVADEVFWGTNGAVEAYLEALATVASASHGHESRLAGFFRTELEGFFPGKVVSLDEWVADVAGRRELLELFEVATARLVPAGAFTEHGEEWVRTVISALQARIAITAPATTR